MCFPKCFLFILTMTSEGFYIVSHILSYFFLNIEAYVNLLPHVCYLPGWARSFLCVYLNLHSHLMLHNTHFEKLYMNFIWLHDWSCVTQLIGGVAERVVYMSSWIYFHLLSPFSWTKVKTQAASLLGFAYFSSSEN